jgi:hemoglobin-like flavoprotein
MTPEQVTLVQESFRRIAPQSEAVARTFYERLFALDPALRPLFADDMRGQRRKLMAMLALAVDALERPDVLAPVLRALGWRHFGYGAEPRHFATVGDALLAALGEHLGPAAFDREMRAAWTACYVLVATVMCDAMHEAREQAEAVATAGLAA